MISEKLKTVEARTEFIEALLPHANKSFEFKNNATEVYGYADLQVNGNVEIILHSFNLSRDDIRPYMFNNWEENMHIDLVPLAFELNLPELSFIDDHDDSFRVRLIRTDNSYEWGIIELHDLNTEPDDD